MRYHITGVFEVPGKTENERRVINFCVERRLWVDNTFFKHTDIHKYIEAIRD